MAQESLSVFRFVVVASLPVTAAKGDTCVLSLNGHLYTYDGSGWIDNGSAGGGGGSGTETVTFGPSPGSTTATKTVIGQTSITATSVVQAWVRMKASVDHTADEHRVESLRCSVGDIVPGTGFTIYVDCFLGKAFGTFNIDWEWR